MKRVLIALTLVTAVAGGAVAAASAREPLPQPLGGAIRIRIEHSRFEPARIAVSPGSTVRFVIVNEDPIAHEFILGDQELQDVHEVGIGHHHGEMPGEISVPAGSTRTTTYTFPEASAVGGTLLLGCHIPGHWDYGMRGDVTIA